MNTHNSGWILFGVFRVVVGVVGVGPSFGDVPELEHHVVRTGRKGVKDTQVGFVLAGSPADKAARLLVELGGLGFFDDQVSVKVAHDVEQVLGGQFCQRFEDADQVGVVGRLDP